MQKKGPVSLSDFNQAKKLFSQEQKKENSSMVKNNKIQRRKA